MSQQPLQQPPRSYSPWQQTQTPDNFLPPAKRQRLDIPSPASPYASSPQSYNNSPGFSNIALPNSYNPQRQPNGTATLSPSGATQRSAFGDMGPPQRPAERPTDRQEEKPEKHLDINDLSDLVTSSGIDIREEENYLAASYRNDRNSASFNNQSTRLASPQKNFDLLSQNSFGAIGTQRSSAFFHQPLEKSQEQELYDKHKKAARAVNESQQYHLEHPFLWGNGVRQRMERIANDNGVRVPLEGLFDRVPQTPQAMSGSSMKSSDGSAIVVAQAPSVLNRNAPLEPLLSLLSLAANDRLRGLLEDAYGLARGRQFSSDGVVPPEWSSLAKSEGAQPTTAVPTSISKTTWDDPDGAARSMTVKDENQALPSPPNSEEETSKQPQPLPTIALPKNTSITQALTTIAHQDRAAEEARHRLRAARRAKKAAQAVAAISTPDSSGGTDAIINGDGGKAKLPPGMLGERAPEVKMTKKEREKLAKQDLSDEVATRNANTTATMQLGGIGKSYSWMQKGGAASKPSTPKPLTRPGGGGGEAGPGSGGPQRRQSQEGWPLKDRRFGEWREDGAEGRGIQLRDWIGVLEADGRERKALGWAFARMGREREGVGQIQTPGMLTPSAQEQVVTPGAVPPRVG